MSEQDETRVDHQALAENVALRRYVYHRETCAIKWQRLPVKECTCGVDAVLAHQSPDVRRIQAAVAWAESNYAWAKHYETYPDEEGAKAAWEQKSSDLYFARSAAHRAFFALASEQEVSRGGESLP